MQITYNANKCPKCNILQIKGTMNQIEVIANKIEDLFYRRKKRILSVYFTAGYPKIDATATIITNLEQSGVDLIEIGIPFSDPVADGDTIQHSNHVALKNGMTIRMLFEQLRDIRNRVEIPLIMMSYLNPVYQYGIEKFFKKCQDSGIDDLIIPDFPLYGYENKLINVFDCFNLKFIMLVTPQTAIERIRKIDFLTGGFIYLVSSASTTGSKGKMSSEQMQYFKRIHDLGLNNPLLVGFGISNRESFVNASRYAAGAIIGSAFIRAITQSDDLKASISSFVQSIKAE